MDLEQFWALIAQSRQNAAGNIAAQEKALAAALAELEPDDLVAFDARCITTCWMSLTGGICGQQPMF